jgi:hypothetical protein
VDDDAFVFEPNDWDVATDIGIRVDAENHRQALGELADAMLVRLEAENLNDSPTRRCSAYGTTNSKK